MNLSSKVIPLCFATAFLTGNAMAANQGGKVTFTGNITNSACSISPESSDQTVDLGQISIKDLTDGDRKSTPRNFDISLENCVLNKPKLYNWVTITFNGSGATFNPEILGTTGTASGIGIAISEQNSGDYLPLGVASSPHNLLTGDNTLHFSAYLVGGLRPTEGDFTAVANFTLDYL
ncbi:MULTISPECIES: fimbrial protein [Enterobacter]|uniref:fimbrial protein n=1 Tax=Enterobacter TaxID=547 RepID=UPI001F2EAC15|nr:fimbrial protein [Enterobacter roggenkampii]MCE5967226.1 type 1 fimbrial protein [Enterobacter roggenkampii]MCE5971658.1 type 1 fimbrial protein [Enterobacter roggenkampii]UHY24941.1 type 1 fimbrial protein [Enterobacter roggenkampii]HDS5356316.1 type 1 fimbrial protein [Enterobacter kobei]